MCPRAAPRLSWRRCARAGSRSAARARGDAHPSGVQAVRMRMLGPNWAKHAALPSRNLADSMHELPVLRLLGLVGRCQCDIHRPCPARCLPDCCPLNRSGLSCGPVSRTASLTFGSQLRTRSKRISSAFCRVALRFWRRPATFALVGLGEVAILSTLRCKDTVVKFTVRILLLQWQRYCCRRVRELMASSMLQQRTPHNDPSG